MQDETEGAPRKAGRKPILTREAIVAAAMRLLERDGLAALTIRNVAAELGVKSASLYWHFPTKDALIDRLADDLLASLERSAPSDDWRADLRAGALGFYRRLTQTRDAALLRAGRLVAGPNTLRWMEAGLEVFRRAGLGPTDAALASHAVHVYVVGAAIFAAAPLSAIEADGGSSEAALASARAAFAHLPPDAFPNLAALAGPLTEGDHETRFLYGLDRLIEGVATRARASSL